MDIWQRYDGYIFDLDGTLADSMPVWDNLCREWAATHGHPFTPALEEAVFDMTLPQASRYLVQALSLSKTTAQVYREWEALLTEKYRREAALKEGAGELLTALESRGYRLGLATASAPAAARAFLGDQGVLGLFAGQAYSEELDTDKTQPFIYLACAEAMGVVPHRCLVFEDLPAAALGARRAGMGLVAVWDSSNPHWDSFWPQADYALRSYPQFLAEHPLPGERRQGDTASLPER